MKSIFIILINLSILIIAEEQPPIITTVNSYDKSFAQYPFITGQVGTLKDSFFFYDKKKKKEVFCISINKDKTVNFHIGGFHHTHESVRKLTHKESETLKEEVLKKLTLFHGESELLQLRNTPIKHKSLSGIKLKVKLHEAGWLSKVVTQQFLKLLKTNRTKRSTE